jgi:hypothetical protein
MNQTSEPIVYLLYGGAKKSCFEMTAEELQAAAQSSLRRAREKAFSKGLPIYSYRNKLVVAEYPDGHTEVVTS